MKFEKLFLISIGLIVAALLLGVIFSTDNFKETRGQKTIYVDGLEEKRTIDLEQETIVYVSGERSHAVFTKKSNPHTIHLYGLYSKVTLCKDIHGPTIEQHVLSSEVIWINC